MPALSETKDFLLTLLKSILKGYFQKSKTRDFLFNVYFWETETEHELGRGRERGKHRIQTGSRLWAVSTESDAGLELTNCEITIGAKVELLTYWATQVPLSPPNSDFSFDLVSYLMQLPACSLSNFHRNSLAAASAVLLLVPPSDHLHLLFTLLLKEFPPPWLPEHAPLSNSSF